jgi:diacylglycerol kinase family enzyme
VVLPLAARTVVEGIPMPIDVAELNGRVFINNSSIGLYPRIVDHRDRQRQRLGRGKWMAMFFAFITVFRRYPTVSVRIGVGDQSVRRTTPFVFIGNNRYEIRFTRIGSRTALDRGELSLYVANRTGRFGLLRLAARALLGTLEQARDFDAMTAREAWIETDKKDLRVAIDGEIVRRAPPLHYTTRPGALRVILPRPANRADAATT